MTVLTSKSPEEIIKMCLDQGYSVEEIKEYFDLETKDILDIMIKHNWKEMNPNETDHLVKKVRTDLQEKSDAFKLALQKDVEVGTFDPFKFGLEFHIAPELALNVVS